MTQSVLRFIQKAYMKQLKMQDQDAHMKVH